MKTRVLINNTTGYDLSNYGGAVEEAVRETLRRYSGQAGETEVSVTFVTNDEIRAMNKRYRKIDEVTDVLSFPSGGGEREGGGPSPLAAHAGRAADEPEPLGDIVIGFDHACAQARRLGNTVRREIVFLAVHGALHLLGYDHPHGEPEPDGENGNEDSGGGEMLRKQREIVRSLCD